MLLGRKIFLVGGLGGLGGFGFGWVWLAVEGIYICLFSSFPHQKLWQTWKTGTLRKTNMDTQNDGLEKVIPKFPLNMAIFWYLCKGSPSKSRKSRAQLLKGCKNCGFFFVTNSKKERLVFSNYIHFLAFCFSGDLLRILLWDSSTWSQPPFGRRFFCHFCPTTQQANLTLIFQFPIYLEPVVESSYLIYWQLPAGSQRFPAFFFRERNEAEG